MQTNRVIVKNDVVIHTLSWLPFKCENTKMERWMNENRYYVKQINNHKQFKMRHVEKALYKLVSETKDEVPKLLDFIKIENAEDTKGVAPVVSFIIQSDPIKEVGVNGVQALDMLKYVKCLIQSLNEAFPCIENERTITHLEAAVDWQERRTKDRIERQVEGLNKA